MYTPASEKSRNELKGKLKELFENFSTEEGRYICTNFSISLDKGLECEPSGGNGYSHRFEIKAKLSGDVETVCKFYLGSYPNNCGALILSNLIVYGTRKCGIGTKALQAAELIAEYCGYSHLQATTNDDEGNQVFKNMALKNGWKEIDTFINKRSTNEINVLCKHFYREE